MWREDPRGHASCVFTLMVFYIFNVKMRTFDLVEVRLYCYYVNMYMYQCYQNVRDIW